MAGRRPINEEVKARAKELLEVGEFTNQEIADMCGISERSVRTIKKEMPDIADQASRESAAVFARYNKSEIKYIRKLAAEQALFEDEEEGWVYHVTKGYAQRQATSMWWGGIAYPESVSGAWIDRLRLIGCEIAISPLHDKDVWEHDSPAVIDEETGEILAEKGIKYQVGDRKKAHWHFILKFPQRIGFREVNKLIRPITMGPYLQKCYTLKGAYEYFVHLNHPNRYQYDKSEIQTYNGFVIEPTRADQMYILQDILRTIRAEEIDSLLQLTVRFDTVPEYLFTIRTSCYMIGKLIDDIWRQHNPDYAKKVQIVDSMEVVNNEK